MLRQSPERCSGPGFAQEYRPRAVRNRANVFGHNITDLGRRLTLFQRGNDFLDLEAGELRKRPEVDQGGRLEVAETDAGRLEQAELAAGIDTVHHGAGGRLERFPDTPVALELGHNALVQVDRELTARSAAEEVVERHDALYLDGRNTQCAAAGFYVFAPDVSMRVLRRPQPIEHLRAVGAHDVSVKSGCRRLVASQSETLRRSGPSTTNCVVQRGHAASVWTYFHPASRGLP